MKAFGRHKIAPYLLAGGGGGKAETAGGVEQKLRFGEVGIGLMLRGRWLSVGVDVRSGVRKFREPDAEDSMRTTTSPEPDDHEHYTRGRVLALVNF